MKEPFNPRDGLLPQTQGVETVRVHIDAWTSVRTRGLWPLQNGTPEGYAGTCKLSLIAKLIPDAFALHVL